MKVLVTGGAGFIGSHVVDCLIESGHETVVVDNLATGKALHVHPKAKLYVTDILSEDLREIFAAEKPRVVIHQAAQVSVKGSVDEPLRDAEINILGTLNLLECCRATHVEKLIYASSAAVYGDPVYVGVDEQHPIQPLSLYGVSKYTPELYIKVYHHLYGLNYTILRYANVYGPRQDAAGEGGVVSIFIDKLLKGEHPIIYGDGEQTRDFVYVADVAAANVMALTRGDGGVFNVSTNTQTSVNELLALLSDLLHVRVEPRYEPPRPGDIRNSFLDNTLAVEALDWQPKYSLRAGLDETIVYYQNRRLAKV